MSITSIELVITENESVDLHSSVGSSSSFLAPIKNKDKELLLIMRKAFESKSDIVNICGISAFAASHNMEMEKPGEVNHVFKLIISD